MRGLIFNLLADLARDANCEEEAWTVALAVSQEVSEELSTEADEECGEALLELMSEVSLQGGADFTFRWLMRSAGPFCEEDWDELDELCEGTGALPEHFENALLELGPLRRRPGRE